MRLPEFTAERSLGKPSRVYHGRYVFGFGFRGLATPVAIGQFSQSRDMVEAAMTDTSAAMGGDDDVEIVNEDALQDAGGANGAESAAGDDGDQETGDEVELPDDSDAATEPTGGPQS